MKVFESHNTDCRYNELDKVCTTITAHYGTGGCNAPIVVKETNNDSNLLSNVKHGVQNGHDFCNTKSAESYHFGGGCEALIAEKRRRYIVRRLTPLECSRLQGFPDGYADTSVLEDMTEEEIQFWEDVRKTYAEVMGKTYKPCKDKQALLKWYNGLHTDSSEYKMWGNGMCYYNMYHVIQGIVNHEKNI